MSVSFLPLDAVKIAIALDDAQKADYIVPLSTWIWRLGKMVRGFAFAPSGLSPSRP
jgi:hypothetical protein